MKKFILFLFLAFIFSFSLITTANALTYDKETVKKISSPIVKNIVKAMETANYDLFIKDMNEPMAKAITREKFLSIKNICKNSIGNYVSSKYSKHKVTSKNGTNYLVVDYKAKYTINKVKIRITLEQKANRYYVAGLRFKVKENVILKIRHGKEVKDCLLLK